MADTRKNNKAPLLDAYFEKEGLHFFQKRPLGDGEDTAVYLTAIPAAGHRLLTAVLTDSSIYANIRCHLGRRAWGKADDGAYLEFLRKLNAAHAFFKYAANQQGGLYVDICIPARDDHFEPAMIRTAMNLLVYHLGEEYASILPWLDEAGDAEKELNR